MNDHVAAALREPEGAEWIPAGFRQPVSRWFRGRFDEVAAVLPQFDRKPFSLQGAAMPDSNANELYDLIVRREQAEGAWTPCPTGVVSKTYRLIEHRDAAAVLAHAFGKVGIDPYGLDTHATLLRYGATMSLEVNLPPNWMFDPGDGHPLLLQLRCQNSVDGTSQLRVALVWYRLVCTNGLIVGTAREQRGFVHREATHVEDVIDFLTAGLVIARRERLEMARTLHLPVDPAKLPSFVDTTLKTRWGSVDAARFLNIARTGHDAELVDRFQPGFPSEKHMKSTLPVPGSPEKATSAWHVAQALSWIARSRKDPSAQLDRLQQIPEMLSGLLER
ncbi:MAG: DUF932 domain-containing protein [Betaproteobacteria bacterium]|nr:DUF932 domain-containing protein [Betaproteobacteria bacterium]